MPVDVVLGLQWGDEGKGKIVDFLAPSYDIVARFQGGPNAGHTIYMGDSKVVLHSIPSGVLHERPINLIGNGVVLDPAQFAMEVQQLESLGIDLYGKLLISERAHLILPTHRLLDASSESHMGERRIGSTLRGIGPAYTDKAARQGLRVGDIRFGDFVRRYEALRDAHLRRLDQQVSLDLAQQEQQWWAGIERMRAFRLVSGEQVLYEALSQKQLILAEGAQGTMLDIDFGTYPYVTSSNTTAGGVCTGLGIPPTAIRSVLGVIKAYCTRVGSGPFPTELNDETGERLRQAGQEFGATTGRPRRCGWLDLVAVRYAIRLSGVQQLIVTKADVLNGFDPVQVATAYLVNGQPTEQFPYDLVRQKAVPVYRPLRGWNLNHQAASHCETLQAFLDFVAQYTGVPVSHVSTGPQREQVVCFA
ncbi:MAG: adenylosuccinate synthase [Chitinophagales bacterium]|nr:adenylosuccinate synthase [Chitinophagales bacterium]MDW8428490.1 adenylosuccinate synthase [Chitinophagales bacterium]